MPLIQSALEAVQRMQIEEGDRHSKALSMFGADYFRSHGEKKADFDRYNPYGRVIKIQQAKEKLNPDVAKTFVKLIQAGKVPDWVVKQIDLDLIQDAAE